MWYLSITIYLQESNHYHFYIELHPPPKVKFKKKEMTECNSVVLSLIINLYT